MEITSCLYSEIPELRIEWRLLPSQYATWPRSSACLPTHRASTKINTLWPVPCSLSQQTPHLFPRGPDWCVFFLENCSFLSYLPMSKQLITTSRLHRFRNEEWMMMAMVMLMFSHLVVSDSVTSWTTAHQAPLSSTVFWSLLRFMSTESMKLPHLSHPLWLPSPLAFSLSQHQVLFQWVSTSRQVVNFLMNSQGWFPLGLTGFIFLLSKGLPRRFSSTTVRKHQFLGT